MGLQEIAQTICCNMLVCCPWLRSWFLENHRGVRHWLGARQKGVQPVLPWTLLWDPQERQMAAGAEEGDGGAHGILAVTWQGKYLDRGTERSCSYCGSRGASALHEGDSGGSGKGSYSPADPPVCTLHLTHCAELIPCTMLCPAWPQVPLGQEEITIQVHPGRFGAVIPQDVTSTGSGAHRFGDSSVHGEDPGLCPVQTE